MENEEKLTVKDLKEFIKDLPDDMEVYGGFEGQVRVPILSVGHAYYYFDKSHPKELCIDLDDS